LYGSIISLLHLEAKMPLIKKARFAALCKVSRASIGELVVKGVIVADPSGLIDTDHPANQSYILKHNPSGLLSLASDEAQPSSTAATPGKRGRPRKIADHSTSQDGEPEADRATEPSAAAAPPAPEALRAAQPDQAEAPAGKKKQKGNGLADVLASAMGLDDLQSEAGEGNAAFTPSEMVEVLRKNLYEAQKVKADAQLKQANLDKLHGSLGERDVFESFILELWQSLQRNYIDVAPKQASLICKRLGMVGHETEVMDVLEGDISKRMDNVAHEIKSILEGRMTQKADIEEDEDEAELAASGKKGGKK
jgi:hypothetical protein